MIKISKKEINDFRKANKKIVKLLKFHVGYNPAMRWYEYKNPLTQAKNYAVMTVCKFLPPCEIKNNLYRLLGMIIGKNVSIANDSIIDTIFPELIKIEDNVIIGWGTKLFTHEFTLDGLRIGSILVKKNSMVGEFSVVRPGTTIGKNSMIAAMSFINEDVQDNTLEGGVPIHIIRHYERMKNKNIGKK